MLTDVKFELEKNLEYGANLQQPAQIYSANNPVDYKILNDKTLLFNDIIDLKTGLDIVSEFYDVKASVIIKCGMPCGVALASTSLEAYQKAFDCDPIGALASTVVFSDTVDENIASLVRKMNFNIIAAPDFTEKSVQMLQQNDKIKIVKINTPLEQYRKLENYEITVTPFGTLVQAQDKKDLDPNNFKVLSKTKPTAEMIEDAIFAWKVVKHAKSEAIVIAKDFKTLSVSQGNTNMISGFEQAIDYACNESKDAVLATDSKILTVDNINAAVQGRIGLIIQTGFTDKSIIDSVNKYGLVLISTGISHIKH